MDFLTKERPVKLQCQYLWAVKEKVKTADDDPFRVDVEDTCCVALATAHNARETEGCTNKQELTHFVEECFDLPADKIKQIKERAQIPDKVELYLKCKVLRASGLIAKDANGSSRRYCRLGILNEVHQAKRIVKQKDLEHWQKEGLVDNMVSTSVKRATLEPEWNEEFHMSITEPSKEMIVLEVWADDEHSEQGGSKPKGLRGLGTYLAEKTIHKGDDLIGRLFYPLGSIPNSGEEKTLTLYSRTGKKQQGYIRLRLNIGAKNKIPIQTRLSEHAALTHHLMSISAKKDGEYIARWSAELLPKAEELLVHHSVLYDVDALQQACIRLSALIKYHRSYSLNMKAICDLLYKLQKYDMEISSASTPDEWKKKLLADLNELLEEVKDVLMHHLNKFDISSVSDIVKIEERVKTLCGLYSLRPFTEQLSSGNDSLKGTLEKCITEATHNWFYALDALLQPQADTLKEKLTVFVNLAEHCLEQCQRTFKYLNPIFFETGVDYFSVFFVSLDKLLCEVAPQRLEKYRHSSESSTFLIYLSFKGIADMMKHVNKSMYQGLSIPRFHEWFKDMVKNWISIATDKCKEYTVKAIAADTSTTVTNDVMFSSSALDTTGFLFQIGSFWKHLDWPVASVAYGYAIYVVESMSECALFYVEEVSKNLRHEDMFDEKAQFRATEKVCITLNNMEQIRLEICQIEEKLELQSFYDWLENEEKLGSAFKGVVSNLLQSADEDISNKIDHIMLGITEKVSPDIQALVQSVISEEGEMKIEEALDPLLEYLHHNLQTFVKYLNPAILKMILNHMWRVSVDSVEKSLKEITSERDTDSIQFLQKQFSLSVEKPVPGDASEVKKKKMKLAVAKKSPKALHEKLFTAIKSLGDDGSEETSQSGQQFHERFFTAIKTMGDACMESVDKSLEEMALVSKKGAPKSAELHQRLFKTLEIMRDFYHCGGNGLDDEGLESETYKVLYAKLDILRSPTEELVLHFFSDLAKHQHQKMEQGKKELGTLLISVGYLKQSSVVEVDVIQGENLPGLDKGNVKYLCNGGLPDPFVQLTLMPTWAFTSNSRPSKPSMLSWGFASDSTKPIKTTVKNRTQNPFFNESLKLPAKQTEIDIEGTVLVLTIFDYNLIGANEFTGMCVVDCKDIPQMASPQASLTDPNAPQRKNLTLPVFRYTTETPVFFELDARARLGDDKANDFFKTSRSTNLIGNLHQLRHNTSVFDI